LCVCYVGRRRSKRWKQESPGTVYILEHGPDPMGAVHLPPLTSEIPGVESETGFA
jgi:hypothetical protein